jgi:hypothetical protein
MRTTRTRVEAAESFHGGDDQSEDCWDRDRQPVFPCQSDATLHRIEAQRATHRSLRPKRSVALGDPFTIRKIYFSLKQNHLRGLTAARPFPWGILMAASGLCLENNFTKPAETSGNAWRRCTPGWSLKTEYSHDSTHAASVPRAAPNRTFRFGRLGGRKFPYLTNKPNYSI